MKIAMLTNNYKPFVGGVPISVERQARELVKRGHEVTVFAPYYDHTEESDGRSLERIIRYHTLNRKMENGMVYPGFYLNEITEVFERETFDCIHVHHPMFVGTYALYLGRKYHLPVIYTYHTRYEDYLHYLPAFRSEGVGGRIRKAAGKMAGNYIVPAYMRWFSNQCDLVFAPSLGMQRIMRENGITTKIEVLPTGLDDSFYTGDLERQEELKKKYKKEKRYLFATVSRLEQEKNYGFLLRGIAELKAQIGNCFRVMIIGDGSQASELKTRTALLGIGDVVEFVGNVPNQEVKDYLGASDAFLFASKSETQGIVLAEAMAAGCPVVAVDAVGTDDVIRDGVNGFLTGESESEWAGRAAELIRSWKYPERKAAALMTAESYRASAIAEQEEELYRRCIWDKMECEEGYSSRVPVMGKRQADARFTRTFREQVNYIGR